MKRNEGISVISLVITIIVLVIVISVTAYQGANIVQQTKQTMTVKRLEAVATAVLAYEKELGYAGIVSGDFVQIKTRDYSIMGLQSYADTKTYPPILIKRTKDTVDPNKKIYTLKTPKDVNNEGVYKESEYVTYEKEFYEEETTEHYKVEFDSVRGVNRPLLTSDMMPVKVSFAGNEDPLPVVVTDIYTDEWYNYSKESPMWANVMINNSNTMYVWIPRFAYRVKNFYISTDYSNIPSSAIDIIFLKGTSDLMPNDEVLPTGYQVHPAFQYREDPNDPKSRIDLAGFWVAKRNIDFADSLISGSGVVAADKVLLANLHPEMDSSNVESHLIKNTEWSAIAYLSHYTVGKTENGNSLINSASGVLGLNERCFVAGGLKSVVWNNGSGTLPYADRYIVLNEDEITYESFEGYSGDNYGSNLSRKFGDGIIATSTGLSENSAWFGGRSVRISDTKPYILRGIDNNLFSYDSVENHPERGAMYRNVLIVTPR